MPQFFLDIHQGDGLSGLQLKSRMIPWAQWQEDDRTELRGMLEIARMALRHAVVVPADRFKSEETAAAAGRFSRLAFILTCSYPKPFAVHRIHGSGHPDTKTPCTYALESATQ